MPYCSKCGVEVQPGTKKCPLCGTPIQQFEEENEELPLYPEKKVKQKKERLSNRQKRIFAWEIVTATIMTIIVLLLLINAVVDKNISWSLYPVASLMALWLFTTFPLFFPTKVVILVVGELLTLISYLAALDGIDGKIQWFHRLALPIVFLISLIAFAVTFSSIKVKRKGANIAAFILFGISAICIGIDLIITFIISGKITLTWSLIAAPPIIIVGAFLIYVHYRFKHINIKKRFFF